MLKWSPDLSVGVPEIDDQHKLLADRANLLFEKLPGSSPELVLDAFSFFESFIATHFETEASYMDSPAGAAYKNAPSHKAIHERFLNEFREYRQEMEQGATDQYFVFELTRWITDWYTEHINTVDKELGEALRAFETSKKRQR